MKKLPNTTCRPAVFPEQECSKEGCNHIVTWETPVSQDLCNCCYIGSLR